MNKKKYIFLIIKSSEFGCELILPSKKAESLAKSLLRYYCDKVRRSATKAQENRFGWKPDSFMKVEFISL
jgi:hypothetical protein